MQIGPYSTITAQNVAKRLRIDPQLATAILHDMRHTIGNDGGEVDTVIRRAARLMGGRRNLEEPGRYRFPDDATFFQSREVDHYEKTGETRTLLDGTVEEVERAVYKPMPIREVVQWAQTSRGGHQLPLFRDEPDGGCFRWGFCDPPSSDSE